MKYTTKKSGFLKALGSEVDKNFKIGLILTGILFALAQIANFFIVGGIKERLKNINSTQLMDNFMDTHWIAGNFLWNKEMIMVAFIIMMIIIFTGYIWFSEWFGNNKTAYTLLTTPVSKSNIITAKFFVAYMFFLINYALLLVSRFIYIVMLKTLPIKLDIKLLNNILSGNLIITEHKLIIPILVFAAGGIALIFTFALLNRWKSIIGSAVGILAITVEMSILLYILYIGVYNDMFLGNAFIMATIYVLVAISVNFVVCTYLLKNKVHV